MSYAQQIRQFFVDNGIIESNDKIKDHESLLDQGIIDSIIISELTDYISTTYQFRVKPEDLVPNNFDSFDAIQAYIERNIN